MMGNAADVAVIGGGLVGLATARALADRAPDVRIVVLEAEPEVARHQSGRNSGVIHSGVYYRPGSLKAELCVEGSGRLTAFCADYAIPFERSGKVIVATEESEIGKLADIEQRGTANGLTDLQILDPAGLREVEPHATGLAALWVPQAGVVDFGEVARRLARILVESGHVVQRGFDVVDIRHTSGRFRLTSATGDTWDTEFLANCAGLHSDRIAALAGERPSVRILPFRGEYYVMRPERDHLVHHLVYPVPDPRFPFLGVHFTRRIDGTVEVGPNAVLAFGRHHYRGEGRPSLGDTWDMARGSALWRLGARYWRTGSAEMIRSRSRRLYAASARRLIPAVQAADLRRGGSGIRAQAVDRNGALLDDFAILESENAVHVLNAPSPAATACLAIGDRIADRVLAHTG